MESRPRNALLFSLLLHSAALAGLWGVLRLSGETTIPLELGEPAPAVPSARSRSAKSALPAARLVQSNSPMTAPAAATSVEPGAAESGNSYFSSLRQRVLEHQRYPREARIRRLEATIDLRIELGPEGELVDLKPISAQNPHVLEAAALQAVRDAAPFPAPPAGFPLKFTLPIVFKLE